MVLLWFIHLGIIFWLALQLSRQHRQPELSRYFWIGLALKLLGGILFGWYYHMQINGGDTWTFFHNSKILAQWGTANVGDYLWAFIGGKVPDELIQLMHYESQPRALFMAKMLSLFTIFTAGNYWLTSMYLSLFAYAGLWTLTLQIISDYKERKTAALAAFIFLPSAIFWGSGISKEAIYMGGFGFLVTWFWPYFRRKPRVWQWILAPILVVILFNLKYYYIVVLVSVLVATFINVNLPAIRKPALITGSRWVVLLALLIFGLSWMHPNLRFHHLAAVVKTNAELITELSSNSALIEFQEHADPTVWVVANLPRALFTGLLRPSVGDWGGIYQNLAILENLVIAVFLAGALVSFSSRRYHKLDWLPCLVYVLILAGMLTLATPNFGTLVRYKVSYLPVFVFLVLYQNKYWDRLVARLI